MTTKRNNLRIKSLFNTPTYKQIAENDEMIREYLKDRIDKMSFVRLKLGLERQARKGIDKYGQLLDDNLDLSSTELDLMLDEEIFDSIAYLSRLILQVEKEEREEEELLVPQEDEKFYKNFQRKEM